MKSKTVKNAALEQVVERSPGEAIKRVLKARGVTAEQVLAAIFDTLAEDCLHLLPEDDTPLRTHTGSVAPVPPAVTALSFRRLLQRMCVVNLKHARREDDATASNDEWMNAVLASNRGIAQAAAVEAFDAVSLVAAKDVEQQKAEAEMMGQPDPYPQLQFVDGSQTEMNVTLPAAPAECPSDDDDTRAKNVIWN